MAELDIKALRAKLNQLKGQSNRSNATWKPAKGETVIRIVPWIGNKHNPFIELFFHYLGNKTYLSPLSYGKPDPISEFADKLKSTGDRDDWLASRQFQPKLRTYVPIIVRGEEKEGVKFWSFGKTVYEKLLKVINDPDYGDITDPVTGRDITVTFIPQKDSDTNFAKTDVLMKPNQTPLASDPSLVKRLLAEQPDIKEMFTEPSYDDLKGVLEAYLQPQSQTQSQKTPAALKGDYPEGWDSANKSSAPSTSTPSTPSSAAPESDAVAGAPTAPKKSDKSAEELRDEFDRIFG